MQGPRDQPLSVGCRHHGHEGLLEETERVAAAAKPARRFEQLPHPEVVSLSGGGHHGDGSGVLTAVQFVVQVLPRLQVAQQGLEQGAAEVGQHCRGQTVACLLALQPQAVPSAAQRVNLRHAGEALDACGHR